MSNPTQCLFCAHEFTARDRRRKFCYECLPLFFEELRSEYMQQYEWLRAACGISRSQSAACSRIPKGHPANPIEPTTVHECQICSVPVGRGKTYCSSECRRLGFQRVRRAKRAAASAPAPVPPTKVLVASGWQPKGETQRQYRNVGQLVEELPIVGACRFCDGELRPWWTLYSGQSPQRRCYSCYLAKCRAKRKRVHQQYNYSPSGALAECRMCGTPFQRDKTHKHLCSDECKSIAAKDRDRRQNVRRRGAVAGEHYSLKMVIDKSGGCCHLCGEVVDVSLAGSHPDGPSIDHLVPLTHGGLDCFTNVALAHLHCNVSRGVKPLEVSP